jgi:hypothetical protein
MTSVSLSISDFFPQGGIQRDGGRPLKVATRLGVLHLPRQVCFLRAEGRHVLPGNRLLPAHTGMLITRALQEWACLLALDLPLATAQRLLGWQAGEEQVLCSNEIGDLVREHGAALRQAEEEQVVTWLAHPEPGALQPRLVPRDRPRRPSAWPAELNTAVEAALATEAPTPPAGVKASDWERVLAVRRQEGDTAPDGAALARLGPEVQADEVVATVDEVVVRQPDKQTFGELRTARISTADGYRYLCGVGDSFLQTLLLLLLVLGASRWLTLVADGGRWITAFFATLPEHLPQRTLILDWYHLRKKCKDRLSRLGGDKAARKMLQQQVCRALWQGQVDEALHALEQFRPQVRQAEGALEELIAYLQRHREAVPNYSERRRERRYIGSGTVEKANDLLVARRQKRRGMHWHMRTSEGLARLKLLLLNHEWEAYWRQRQTPQLVAP